MDSKSRWGSAAGLMLGVTALTFTFACGGTRDLSALSSPQGVASQAGPPVVVSCEPHQRTLVRPTVVNGAAVSQVECVAAAPVAGYAATEPGPYVPAASAPISYAPQVVSAPRRLPQPVDRDLGDAEVVPVSSGAARPVRTSQVIYDERPVTRTRSVKKSAVIVGSSAGIGAGVGAAMGGKKGALIGATVGGGGAAIWDQITRRR